MLHLMLMAVTGAELFSLTPPPEVHQVDIQLDKRDRKTSPRSPSLADESLSAAVAQLPPLTARSGRASPSSRRSSPAPVSRRKFTVSRRHTDRSSSSLSPRLTLKLQHVKRRSSADDDDHTALPPPHQPQLNNGRWRSISGDDVITSRCADRFIL